MSRKHSQYIVAAHTQSDGWTVQIVLHEPTEGTREYSYLITTSRFEDVLKALYGATLAEKTLCAMNSFGSVIMPGVLHPAQWEAFDDEISSQRGDGYLSLDIRD